MKVTNSNEDGLIPNLDKLHTTDLGAVRIKRNLTLKEDYVIEWCKRKVKSPYAIISRRGKNWYVDVDGCEITINAYSYTVITAHRTK